MPPPEVISPDETAAVSRVELLLRKLKGLPTISPIVVKLLRLTADAESDIKEIVSLIEADASLTSRILALCKRADLGVRAELVTVERAVVLLGFQNVRATLAGVDARDLFLDRDEDGRAGEERPIDRVGLWRHSLAVACAAERIAKASRRSLDGARPEDAFVCGLLHDIGKWALDALLPKTYARLARVAFERRTDIAAVERSVIGVDHHTAGKRLAEQWGLPAVVRDVIWLTGHAPDAVPEKAARGLIAVVSAADALVNEMLIGWSGDFGAQRAVEDVFTDWGLDPDLAKTLQSELYADVAERSTALGVDDMEERDLLLRSLESARARLSASVDAKAPDAEGDSGAERVLAHLFNDAHRWSDPLHAQQDVAKALAIESGAVAVAIFAKRSDRACWARLFDERGELLDDVEVETEPAADASAVSAALEALPDGSWRLVDESSSSPVVAFAVRTDRPDQPIERVSEIVLNACRAVVRASWREEEAARLGEQLAVSARRADALKRELVESESFTRLGRAAAGAAHEMSNPLAVISGRAQLLRSRTNEPGDTESLERIEEAATRLRDFIETLHFFASPPDPNPSNVNLKALVVAAIDAVRHAREHAMPVRVSYAVASDPVWLDEGQIGQALTELIHNAQEASPRSFIEVRVQTAPPNGRLLVTVADDGCGMTQETLRRAFDPFFSERTAGRGAGLGLARARRLVELNGARLTLAGEPGKGTSATIAFDDWPSERRQKDHRAA